MSGRLTMTNEGIIITTATTPNYRVGVEFYKGTTQDSTYSHDAQIGWHNTGGDGNGSICILPYATSTEPWGGTVGLFITETSLKYNNNPICHAGNSSVSDGGSSWGSSITVKINGTSKTLKIPSNPNTDTKVTQTVTSSDVKYPLLLAPSGQTDTTTTTSYFDSGVTLNPSTNTITANITGSAGSVAWANVTGKPSIPTVTDYYWANIKVSSFSNEATTPIFSTITTTGTSYVATIRPSTTNQHYLGSAANRWKDVFSNAGNFLG